MSSSAFIFIIHFAINIHIHAQQNVLLPSDSVIIQELKGIILNDQSKKPVKNAHVFFNKTTLGTTTNELGEFNLTDLTVGFIDLVVFASGYQPYKSTMKIEDNKNYSIKLELTEKETKINTTSLSNRKLKRTTESVKAFLENEENCFGYCNVINIGIIKVQDIDGDQIIFCEQPLTIENNLTGYAINYFILPTKIENGETVLNGYYYYSEIKANNFDELMIHYWARLNNYLGSENHFLTAFYNSSYEKEGFFIYNEKGERWQPSLDSRKQPIQNYFTIDLEDIFKIKYMPIRLISQLYENLDVKEIELAKSENELLFNSSGLLFDQRNNLFVTKVKPNDFIASNPTNYYPPVDLPTWNDISKLQEEVYMHTNKNYYYPNETIWFKVYMQYQDSSLIDSLSRVLHVELINSDYQVVKSQTHEIINGSAYGSIQMSSDLEPGNYAIRAYTNWMRNFENMFYTKEISILSPEFNYSIESNNEIEISKLYQVELNSIQQTYLPREKILIDVSVKDSLGNFIEADLSVSVINTTIIKDDHLTNKLIQNKPHNNSILIKDNIEYKIERSLNKSGTVVTKNKDNLIVQFYNWEEGVFDEAEVNTSGNFELQNLNFYDSLEFNVLVLKNGNKMEAPIIFYDKDIPEIPDLDLKEINESDLIIDNLARTYSFYQPDDDVTVLEEIEIKSTRIETPKDDNIIRAYGLSNPEYTLTSEEIFKGGGGGGSLLIALQGKIPHLTILPGGPEPRLYFTRYTTSGLNSGVEPVVFIDGLEATNSFRGAADVLLSIDPNSIDRIEAIKGIRSGVSGSGIISIYTKKGFSSSSNAMNFDKYTLMGFTSAKEFYSPNYEKSNGSGATDFRSTLYWNPSFRTHRTQEKTSFSFFAADMPATYRILIEGFTKDGNHVRGIHYVTVVSN
jgi:hypothetical protein